MRKRWTMTGATVVFLLGIINVAAARAGASDPAAVAQATKAADARMKLVDDGDNKQSWESASSIFKNAIR